MTTKRQCLWILSWLGTNLFAAPLAADDFPTPINTESSPTSPMSPEEVVQTVQLPPGFQLTVVASEPQVQNPIAFTTDERGRLWVAENYSWAGSGFGGFDGNQRDRIVVLEDSDGNGTYDKRTVFWDHATKLTSIEVGYGGVWAICLPHLLFIPDENRDDVPDSQPRIILDGLAEGSDIGHTPANGLKWGPDGWLYARHGILASSEIGRPGASESQRFRINTGVWRYHPIRDVAEPVMHGMTNSWGFDFDRHGEIFVINTVIGHLWHVVPGAHTERMFGMDIHPHSYKLIEQVADHVHWDVGEAWNDIHQGVTNRTDAAGGGHAHIGLMIYQGDNWPTEYRDRVYTLNLHGMRINSDILARQGSGYTATHGPDLCFLTDPWFRGMDLITGPDGSVFIADWSDTGECHDHDGVHRTSGRIYKLAYGNPEPLPRFDLAKQPNAELIALLSHTNTWWARQARRVLTERAARQLSSHELTVLHQALQKELDATSDEVARLRILEAIAATGQADQEEWLGYLASPNEYERVAAFKFLMDQQAFRGNAIEQTMVDRLAHLARSDPSGLMKLHLASSLHRLPIELRWNVAEPLAACAEFADDRMLPLMIWFAMEPAVVRQPTRALALIGQSQMPLLAECIARRLTQQIDKDPATSEQLLEAVLKETVPFPESVLTGMALALHGWQSAPPPANWSEVAAKYGKSPSESTRGHVQSLNIVFGDGRALDEIRKIVEDPNAPAEVRRQALRSLLTSRPENYASTLIRLLDDRVLVAEALRGLGQYDDPEIPTNVLARIGRYDAAERADMVHTLTSRPAYAKSLLQAIREQRVAPSELSAFHARQIASFEDEELTKELRELWGDIRVSAADKQSLMDGHKASLTEEVLQQADRSAGRAIFDKTCANCHVLFGAGNRVGPDLTGSGRKNLDYLLENMIDPSASVGVDFRTSIVLLGDGRVLNGVITEQNERTLTLQSAQEAQTLDRNEIEEIHTTAVSLMPDGLLQNLTTEQIRDLIGYLMSDGP